MYLPSIASLFVILIRVLRKARRGANARVGALAMLAFVCASAVLPAQGNHTIRFNGVDTWLDLGSRTGFDVRTCFTLEAWIRPTTFHDTTGIIGNYRRNQFGGSGYGLVLDSTGHIGLVLAHDVGTTDFLWSAQSIELDTWTHVAGNWDGYTLRIYIDGVEVARGNIAGLGVLWTIDNSMAVGRYIANDSGYFAGQIDEVRMWNVCRSAHELLFAKNLRLAATIAGQVSYLQLDEGNGSTTSDAVGNGRSAAVRGSSTWEVSDVNVGVGTTAQSTTRQPLSSHYFNGTDVRVDYAYETLGRPLVITSLVDQPTVDLPPGAVRIAPRAWMISTGADTFTVNMTFYLGRGAIGPGDALQRENLQLFYQPANHRDRWIHAANALAVDTVAGRVTFGPIIAGKRGIGKGGRFVIGTSGDSQLETRDALVIVGEFIERRMCAFGRAQISVLADGRNLRYSWRRNGVPIETPIGPDLAINRVNVNDDGMYQVTIIDQSGDTVIASSALHVVVAPRILADPTDVRVTEGQTLELYAELEGTHLQYQWQHNRVDIPGANAHVLVLSPVDTNTAGTYRLVVSNDCGTDATVDARVHVMRKPVPPPPPPLGIADSRDASPIAITAVPNPSRDRISISLRGIAAHDGVTITLVDARGAIAATSTATIASDGTARATFDASALQAGTYLCRATSRDGVVGTATVVVVR